MKRWPLIMQIIIATMALLALVAISQAAQVTLQWDAPSGTRPDGYRIYQRSHGGSYGSNPAWTGTATTCTITGLAEGEEYYFVARAYSGIQESVSSNEVLFVSEPLTTTPTPEPSPTAEPSPVPTATPASPKGFVLLKDGVAITSLAAGKYSALDGGRLWIVQVSEDVAAAYSGNIITRTFHRAGCRYHQCLTCNRHFETREEAIAAGYRPCGICKP